jgi:hypothetical protein
MALELGRGNSRACGIACFGRARWTKASPRRDLRRQNEIVVAATETQDDTSWLGGHTVRVGASGTSQSKPSAAVSWSGFRCRSSRT